MLAASSAIETAIKVAVADNHIRLDDTFGGGLRSDKAPDQSCECDRVSGDKRDNALPQGPLVESRAHDRSSPPLDRYEQLSGKEIPSPAGKRRPKKPISMHDSASIHGCDRVRQLD